MADKEKIVYLSSKESVIIPGREISVKDVVDLVTADEKLARNLKETRIVMLNKEENIVKIAITDIIEIIQKVYPQVIFTVLNAGDIIVRLEKPKRKKILTVKVIVVSILCFFGSAFTIMAFENDVGTPDIFAKVYKTVMGREATGVTALDISYSIGLAAGIILFFNHIGGRRITKDPTPIEVAMRNYEEDVDRALIATADREGKTIDVS